MLIAHHRFRLFDFKFLGHEQRIPGEPSGRHSSLVTNRQSKSCIDHRTPGTVSLIKSPLCLDRASHSLHSSVVPSWFAGECGQLWTTYKFNNVLIWDMYGTTSRDQHVQLNVETSAWLPFAFARTPSLHYSSTECLYTRKKGSSDSRNSKAIVTIYIRVWWGRSHGRILPSLSG